MPRKKGSLNKISKNEEDYQRTTIRLPKDLYNLLRFRVLVENRSAENIIEDALWNAFKGDKYKNADTPDEWGPDLAEIFLQSLPTPCSIKDDKAKILWVNLSYEQLVEKKLPEIKGKDLFDLHCSDEDFLDEDNDSSKILANIKKVFSLKKPLEFHEAMVINNKGVLIRSQRFLFGNEIKYLGDISFDHIKLIKHHWDVNQVALTKMAITPKISEFRPLFIPFLDEAPVAIALKRPIKNSNDTEIVWANKEFIELAKLINSARNPTFANNFNIINKTTKELFFLDDKHMVVEHDKEVVESKVALCWKENLTDWKGRPRKSLRFPIFDKDGSVKFVGVVSANFRKTTEPAPVETVKVVAANH